MKGMNYMANKIIVIILELWRYCGQQMVIILSFCIHVLVLDISYKKWFSWNGGNLESQNT
jgi:hypothetical protein